MALVSCAYVAEEGGRSHERNLKITDQGDSVLLQFVTKAKIPLAIAKATLQKGNAVTLLYQNDHGPLMYTVKGSFCLSIDPKKGTWKDDPEEKTFTFKVASESAVFFVGGVNELVKSGKIDSLEDMKKLALG